MNEPAPARKPRILFMASQPFFEWRGSPIRLGFDAMAMAQNGYDVDFLTLPVGQRREIEGVRIVRAPNLIRAKKVPIGPSLPKFFFDFVFLFQAIGMTMRRHYDIVHGVEDAGMVALLVGRLARAKVVFEKHSDPASYSGKKGVMRLVMRAYAAVERFVMRHADAVIGTGPGLVRQVNALAPKTPATVISDIPSSLAEPDPEGVRVARARLLALLGRGSSHTDSTDASGMALARLRSGESHTDSTDSTDASGVASAQPGLGKSLTDTSRMPHGSRAGISGKGIAPEAGGAAASVSSVSSVSDSRAEAGGAAASVGNPCYPCHPCETIAPKAGAAASVGHPCHPCHPCETIAPEAGDAAASVSSVSSVSDSRAEAGGGAASVGNPCYPCHPCETIAPEAGGAAASVSSVSDSRAEAGGATASVAPVFATYVGSFAPYQGIDLLFAAMPPALHKCPELRFAVIGGTPQEIAERRAALAAEGLAERVAFVGKVPPDELPCWLAASDIVLSPRIAGVNTPLKLLDYLKVGRAIVATDHEANRLILDEQTALLVPIDPAAFADGVAALASDRERREQIGSRGRRLVDETYNFGVFRAGLAKVHGTLVAAAPSKLG